jgi:sigma-B regulation protein RsbU (phosphoserine phosphatase)
VLNVTDSRAEHLLLCQVLQPGPGTLIEWSPSGIEALEDLRGRAETQLPQLVIIPWVLPLLSGQEFLLAMKADERLSRIPVFVVDDVPEPEVLSLYDAGAHAVIAAGTTLDSVEKAAQRIRAACAQAGVPCLP